MFFDTHAHYDDARFNEDRTETIINAHKNGVRYILNASSDMASVIESINLSQEFEFVYSAVGIHPHEVTNLNTSILSALYDFASSRKVVAIGEIGLDYFYDNSPRELQKHWFAEQIIMAKELKLPIIVHDRDAHEDCMKIIKKENAAQAGGVFHCFSGSLEMAQELIKNNFHISIGGSITFKNARKLPEVVKNIPLDKLLIETDCPYLTPEPYRGKRNDSSYIKLVVEKIAEIRDISVDEVAEATMNNSKNLFRIS
ncbi:MAG: hydrolase, TatD family [Clostridiales bacterium]|jgi:TatD DNase family protein|nr:hydrolase, TatD family [Clostridiales bacterium]